MHLSRLSYFIFSSTKLIHLSASKKWFWPLFLNCVQMITAAAWRLHAAVQISPLLDFLDFIRSVAAGLLKNSRRPASSDPSGRRIMNNSFGQHHPVNAESQGRCAKCKKNTVKDVKNMVFACILCASLIIRSDDIMNLLIVFAFVPLYCN